MQRNHKFLGRILELGYCCPWEFFRQTQGMTNLEIGNFVGVRSRTVRFWRARARHCESNKACHNTA